MVTNLKFNITEKAVERLLFMTKTDIDSCHQSCIKRECSLWTTDSSLIDNCLITEAILQYWRNHRMDLETTPSRKIGKDLLRGILAKVLSNKDNHFSIDLTKDEIKIDSQQRDI